MQDNISKRWTQQQPFAHFCYPTIHPFLSLDKYESIGTVITAGNHLGSRYSPGHCRGQWSKSQNTYLVKLTSTASKTCFKSTKDVSDLFLVHQGRGTMHLLCFWNTLVVLDFAIFIIVACRVFFRDNRSGPRKFCKLLAPHVEFYYLATISMISYVKCLHSVPRINLAAT